MADFQEVMCQWGRMCRTLIADAGGVGYEACKMCPLDCLAVCAMETKDLTALELAEAERAIMGWATEHKELPYPTWFEYLTGADLIYVKPNVTINKALNEQLIASNDLFKPIPADIAEKLGVKPKGGQREEVQ